MPSIQLPLPFPPEEEWEIIPGFDGCYAVSNRGQVRRTKATRMNPALSLLKQGRSKDGYPVVVLSRKTCYVHRLVMLVFRGACEKGIEVNHIDGNKCNNHLSNLEYVTHQENIRHAVQVIKSDFTSKQWRDNPTRLNEERVREIRRLHKSGVSQKKIAVQFGVSQMMICYILKGRYWSHVKD